MQAFLPQKVVPEIAHIALLLNQEPGPEEVRPWKRAKHRKGPPDLLCVLDIQKIFCDMKELGAGLVADTWVQHTQEELEQK